ncbi:MAG TPA: hypothetical protein VHW23_26985 [Kofleriaceae bacterium]|jgi:hypothetical protein|nr:hypothetical protein [Kofleriaceae bacterium]
MKRHCHRRDVLALHEAGHLVAIAVTPGLVAADLVWHRLPDYEIAHVESARSAELDWEKPDDRNTLIARHAAVALAGGAAELAGAMPARELDVRAIHAQVGATDFELAHEWLTLQRYDPDQETLEREIQRLFHEVCRTLAAPPVRAAIATVRDRLLARLADADAAGATRLRAPARELLADLALDRTADFALQATLFDRIAAARESA